MNLNKMSKKDFENIEYVPERLLLSWELEELNYDSIILIPLNAIHESDYRYCKFLFVKDNEFICQMRYDVINISSFNFGIDCLNKSKYIRLLKRG